MEGYIIDNKITNKEVWGSLSFHDPCRQAEQVISTSPCPPRLNFIDNRIFDKVLSINEILSQRGELRCDLSIECPFCMFRKT